MGGERNKAGRSRYWGLGLGLAALLGVLACLPVAWAQEELFLASSNGAYIAVYPSTASGYTPPLRVLQSLNSLGGSIALHKPAGLAVDLVHNELFVANAGNNSILVYGRGDSGNTPPLRTLQGPATGLAFSPGDYGYAPPFGLAVDPVNNELVVVNNANNSVTVYARTASGNTAPVRTLAGAATGLNGPAGMAVDPVNNELVAVNNANNSVTVYARTASGNTAPVRTLAGAATGLNGPAGMAVDLVNKELVVVNKAYLNHFGRWNSSVTVYGRTASGNTAPLRTLAGEATGLLAPTAVVVDRTNDELFVANLSGGITVFARTASGNTAPLRILGWGSLEYVTSLALAPSTPRAVVELSEFSTSLGMGLRTFRTGDTITYHATLTPGPTPTQVDIYLGALLPDGGTFLSLVQSSPGVISTALGHSRVPFLANVTLTPAVVSFSHTFTGGEPVGTYSAYAALVVAGSAPFLSSNQLSMGVHTFPFHCNFPSDCSLFSLDVEGFGGSVTISPGGFNCAPECVVPFAPGTTVTLTAQGGPLAGWGKDCASAGTNRTCTLVMTTNKSASATFTSYDYCRICGWY